MTKLDEELERLSKAATQGVWREVGGDAILTGKDHALKIVGSLTASPGDPAFVCALVNAYRARQVVPAQPSADVVEAVADAIERAECPGREGPFGGYDYGHNEAFYGKAPDGGRYVIRDFRDPASPDWGKWLHQTENRDEHDAMLEKMTREHIATAAITTYEAVSGVAKMREALTWYAEQARLCRLIHSEGDAGRHALSADGGQRARAALGEKP